MASVGIGLALLLVFRTQDVSIFTHTLGAEQLSGGSVGAGMLAALAVGGWVFIGFDACVGASEETRGAARHVPRAIWLALLSVGGARHPQRLRRHARAPRTRPTWSPGATSIRSTTAVVTSFGSWSAKPFAAVVLAAFLACGNGGAGPHRPDDLLGRPRRRPAGVALPARGRPTRRSPIGAIATTTVVACLGLLLGLHSAAVGSLIAFGTAAIYVAFLLVAVAALVARAARHVGAGRARAARPRGRTSSTRSRSRGSRSRPSTSPGRARRSPRRARPAYQVWAAPIVLAVIGGAGVSYLVAAKPQRKLAAR